MRHLATSISLLVCVLCCVPSWAQAPDGGLTLQAGRNGNFTLLYQGTPLLVSQQNSGTTPCANPVFISTDGGWHGIRVTGMGQPMRSERAERDGKVMQAFLEDIPGQSRMLTLVTITGLTATIYCQCRIVPNHPQKISCLPYDFALPTDTYWNAGMTSTGVGYTFRTLEQGWTDVIGTPKRSGEDLRYNLTQLAFARPDFTVRLRLDGPAVPTPGRAWKLAATAAKRVMLSNWVGFTPQDGIDQSFTITLSVTPKADLPGTAPRALALPPAFKPDPRVQVLPDALLAGNLRATAPGNASVELRDVAPGILLLRYRDLPPNGTVTVQAKTPLTLREDIQTLGVQCCGTADIRLLVESASSLYAYGTKRSGGEMWATLETETMQPLKSASRLNPDLAVWRRGNGAVNAPYQFTGLEITPAGAGSGELYLADVTADYAPRVNRQFYFNYGNQFISAERTGLDHAFVYLADFLTGKESYRIHWGMWNLQGTQCYAEGTRQVAFDPEDVISGKDARLELPFANQGSYLLKLVITPDSDELLAKMGVASRRQVKTLRLNILSGVPATPKALPVTRKPLTASLLLNPGRVSNVYRGGEAMRPLLRVYRGEVQDGDRLRCVLKDPQGVILTTDESPITFAGADYVDVPVKLAADLSPMSYYQLEASVVGTTGDQVTAERFRFGRETPLPQGKPSHIPTEVAQYLNGQASLQSVANYEGHEWEDQASAERWMNEQRDTGMNTVVLDVPWNACNPLPGIYEFTALDRLVAQAAAHGFRVVIGLRFREKEMPDFVATEYMENLQGKANGIWGGSQPVISVFAQDYARASQEFTQAVARHYKDHPAILGYEFWGMYADWLFVDNPWKHQLTDFSPSARQHYQTFLQQRYGTVAALNAAYGITARTFAELDFPTDMSGGLLTQALADALEFKLWASMTYYQNTRLFDTVRAVDPERLIVFYNLQTFFDWPNLKAKGVMAANGGAEGEHMTRFNYCLASSFGVPYRGESVGMNYDDPQHIDGNFFNKLSYGPTGAHMHQYQRLFSRISRDTQGKISAPAVLYLEQWMALMRELQGARLVRSGLGVMESITSHVMSIRSVYAGWLPSFSLGDKLYNTEQLWPDFFEDLHPQPVNAATTPVLIAAGKGAYWSAASIEALARYVRGGGTLVADLDTGSINPESIDKRYLLLKRLNLPNPDSTPALFSTPRERSAYTGAADAPLFAGANIVLTQGYAVPPPPGSVTILQQEGKAVCSRFTVGKGTVVLFWGSVQQEESVGLYRAVAAWKGLTRAVKSDVTNINSIVYEKGEARYLLVHRYKFQHEAFDRVNTQHARVSVTGFPAARYAMYDALNNQQYLGDMTREQLAAGLEFDLLKGQTRVMKLLPK
ncbi:MAG TPA: beta-galactosidase [Armatimonadota bacterium]